MDDRAKQGRYSYDRIDNLLHEKSRLGILTSLCVHPRGLSFNELKELCGLTDGNLSRHMHLLEDAGLLVIEKSFLDKKPHTHCRLTEDGRKRFQEYMKELETIIRETARAEKESPSISDQDLALS